MCAGSLSVWIERRRGGICIRYAVYSPVIVAVPFIVLNLEDAIVIAPNFTAFLQHLYRSEDLF
jgi:hypothetical protein